MTFLAPPAPSLDTLLAEIYDRGWYLYHLSDDPDGRYDHWTCAIRLEAGPDSLISHGQGPTPAIALTMAYDQIPGAVPHQLPKPAAYSPAVPVPVPSLDLSSILSRLIPRAKPDRRI